MSAAMPLLMTFTLPMSENLFETILMLATIVLTLLFLKFVLGQTAPPRVRTSVTRLAV